MGYGVHATAMGDHHPPLVKVPGCTAESFAFTHACHGGGTIDPVAESTQVVQGGRPTEAVNGQTTVALEFPQGTVGVGPEDPVDPAGIEPQASEMLLELGNVVTSGHGPGQVQQSIAQRKARLNQCRPGGGVTHAGNHQTPAVLKRIQHLSGVWTEYSVSLGVQPHSGESALKVAHGPTLVALGHWERGMTRGGGVGWCHWRAVGMSAAPRHNQETSCRAPVRQTAG